MVHGTGSLLQTPVVQAVVVMACALCCGTLWTFGSVWSKALMCYKRQFRTSSPVLWTSRKTTGKAWLCGLLRKINIQVIGLDGSYCFLVTYSYLRAGKPKFGSINNLKRELVMRPLVFS